MFDPKKLLDKNGNPSSRKISPYKEEIFAATAWMLPTASIGERFWNLLHGRTSYIEGCTICGNPVHWRGQDGYYQLYCSVQCSGKARTARTPVKQVKKLDALFGPDTGTEVERCAKNGWYRVWTPGNAKYSISF